MMTPARVLEALALCQGLPESRWGRRLQEWIRAAPALTATLLAWLGQSGHHGGSVVFRESPRNPELERTSPYCRDRAKDA